MMGGKEIKLEIQVTIGDTVLNLKMPTVHENYLRFITAGMRTNILTNAFYGLNHDAINKAFEEAIKPTAKTR